MIKEQGLSTMQVSHSMDIGETAIRRWVSSMRPNKAGNAALASR